MVKVKLFGIFRLDTGIREMEAEASSVKELLPQVLEKAKENNPKIKMTLKDLDGCIVVVNGVQKNKTVKLRDGDEVMLMSPVCGG